MQKFTLRRHVKSKKMPTSQFESRHFSSFNNPLFHLIPKKVIVPALSFTGCGGGVSFSTATQSAVTVLIFATPADVVVHLKHQALREEVHMIVAFKSCYRVKIALLELIVAGKRIQAYCRKVEIAILIR